MTEKTISIGVDVGGSHIACAAVDLARGEVLEHTLSRKDVDSMADAATIFGTWAEALASTMDRIETDHLVGVGFAIPGPFDYRNGISRMEHKFPSLFGLTIADELGSLLGTALPMRFLNDATSFATGEAWLGQGKGARKVLAVTLGTGFGSAFIDDGIPVIERDDVPEEGCLWYLPFHDGVADDYFTTRWFVRQYEAISGRQVSGAKEVADEARGGNVTAREVFKLYGRSMGEFLSPWVQKFDANVIVLGGNISGAHDLFGPALQDSLGAACADARVKVSLLGENAAMIGAARLLDDLFWKQVSIQLPRI
jgi:glucokinase